MYTVINNLEPIYTVFLLKVGVEPRLDVLHNGLPAEEREGEGNRVRKVDNVSRV
jgi:hypothetical protein